MPSPDRQLWDATRDGDLAEAEAALEAGADVNFRGEVGWTPLICASSHGHADIVRMLLAAEAWLDTLTRTYQRTAVMHAAGEGHVPVLKLLLAASADVVLRDVDGSDAHDIAKRRHQPVAAEMLSEALAVRALKMSALDDDDDDGSQPRMMPEHELNGSFRRATAAVKRAEVQSSAEQQRHTEKRQTEKRQTEKRSVVSTRQTDKRRTDADDASGATLAL